MAGSASRELHLRHRLLIYVSSLWLSVFSAFPFSVQPVLYFLASEKVCGRTSQILFPPYPKSIVKNEVQGVKDFPNTKKKSLPSLNGKRERSLSPLNRWDHWPAPWQPKEKRRNSNLLAIWCPWKSGSYPGLPGSPNSYVLYAKQKLPNWSFWNLGWWLSQL